MKDRDQKTQYFVLNLIIVNNHLQLESIYKCERSTVTSMPEIRVIIIQ